MEKYKFIYSAIALGCSTILFLALFILLMDCCLFPAESTNIDICALIPFTILFGLISRLLVPIVRKYWNKYKDTKDML